MSVDVSDLVSFITGRYGLDLADRVGREFMWKARGNAPRDKGDLADSIQLDTPRVVGDSIIVSVFTDSPYAGFQNRGTGVYAGEGRIYPTHARALSFFWRKVGQDVVFASVAGTPATHFWDNTVRAWPDIVAAA